MSHHRLQSLLDVRRRGFSLPQAFYLDDDVFAADMEAVFGTEWLFACNACEIKRPGHWVTMEIGRSSLVILRDQEGEIRAFHNTCRHRGSRVCLGERGHASRLVCPYHQWVYELDGRLRNARQMPKGFDTAAYGLKPAKTEVICGLVYVSLAEDPPSLARYREAITPYIAPHRPERTKVAFQSTMIEAANWKLVIENNRECYHCPANHRELLVTFAEVPLPDDPRGAAMFQPLLEWAAAKWEGLGLPHRAVDGGNAFRCVRLPFNEGAVSFTMDGGSACRRLLGDLTDPDLGSVRMFRAPNNWHHFLADHIIHARVLPLAPDRTAVRTTWLVHEDAVEGVDYELERLTEVCVATNEQDKLLAENNHLGIASRAYEPGPYAPAEFMLTQFTDWYADKLAHFAEPPAVHLAATE
jgi:Rieske 2Fe-2S family protein